ncbi:MULTISPECIES: CAAD domain-containing protein [unclassified Coleofasciculus]|uniref:CAAD domain-containing protein n=1 Tax=Cyanophyceae TaxID=3028117 RepID=UPI001687B2ED|nr:MULTISPECIES: CAAD domain-containing protein [unclassified Coleofasciculus]MBD1894496.1 CAAD domain-containing protein [Coleofasciculus sp. FACHB-129]MBD2088074.1 CAAD domain-containing protein [Coleofasciculus sp. FACHB-542]MBD2537490.1 CAAD domain-containing protein [Coleofasciculus sp. FACHB-SPT36]
MNPETPSSESRLESENPSVEVNVQNVEGTPSELQVSSTQAYTGQVQQVWAQIARFLEKMPSYAGNFFSSYQRSLITLGLLLAVLVTLRITVALLTAIHSLPLIAPTLQLIGIGYTAWFVYRYLLTAESRKELSQDFQTLKQQVLGRGASNT